jgi:hypothetical protein
MSMALRLMPVAEKKGNVWLVTSEFKLPNGDYCLLQKFDWEETVFGPGYRKYGEPWTPPIVKGEQIPAGVRVFIDTADEDEEDVKTGHETDPYGSRLTFILGSELRKDFGDYGAEDVKVVAGRVKDDQPVILFWY